MVHRQRMATLVLVASLVGASVPLDHHAAAAVELDAKGEAEAKKASRLYRQGKYEEAADLYAKLSVDYPDMPIFERNVGACFYYLHKPEPALSNLRNYLNHKNDIAPDDKAVVDRWIEEMERLQARNVAPAPPPTKEPSFPAATPPPSLPAGEATVPAAAPPPPLAAPPAPVEPARKPAGADLTATPAPGDTGAAGAPFYKRWWFWGTVGAVVAAGVVTTVVLATRKTESNVPETPLGNQGGF